MNKDADVNVGPTHSANYIEHTVEYPEYKVSMAAWIL